MNIIKLNAIDSTNAYLKDLAFKGNVKNYTVVVAKEQTNGRGQMGTMWQSEGGKNLTFSVLVCFDEFLVSNQFYLSMAVALAVKDAISYYTNTKITIKWPNDILSDTQKVSGVLIENRLVEDKIKDTVIGIGINVNQEKFQTFEREATSLKLIIKKEVNLEDLLHRVLADLKHYISFLEEGRFLFLKKMYLNSLYKYNTPCMFMHTKNNEFFLAKIVDVENGGKLLLELENETFRKFDLKQIKFAK